MSPTEIVRGLYVGDIADARSFRADEFDIILCVLNQWPPDGDPDALWVPVVVADADNLARPIRALVRNLNIIADIVESGLHRHRRVLVHCREGVERSPLAVVWYLCRKRGWTVESAYAHLREIRPQVVDRRSWLP